MLQSSLGSSPPSHAARSFALFCLLYALPLVAAARQTASAPGIDAPARLIEGSLGGVVLDRSGTPVSGASVTLTWEAQRHLDQQGTLTNEEGHFSFVAVPPGDFTLTITATGFATHAETGTVYLGKDYQVNPIALDVATANTVLEVQGSLGEIAQEQVKAEEKQRVLGIVPNFFVTYNPNAAPLKPKQKFELALRSAADPVSFLITGVIAGFEQGQNDYRGYGQGTEGYAKRYGAAYAGYAVDTMISGAILPSLLKQDPRYFYKGSGSVRSRIFYAIANSVVCKGDNGRWQPNYSSIAGDLAAGGLANLYYPAADRHGAGLTFRSALIDAGTGALSNIVQEFVLRRLTPKVPKP